MLLSRLVQLRAARLALVASLLLVSLLVLSTWHSHQHVLKAELFDPASTPASSGELSRTDNVDVAALCQHDGFRPYRQTGTHPRKVYDLFLLSHELDWLEIRLNTLAEHVDYFVIVEGKNTFTGGPKPLQDDAWLHTNTSASIYEKALHYIVEDTVDSTSAWDHAAFVRNSLLYSTFPTLVGSEKEAHEGDVLVVSDIDEIPRPETMMVLRYCEFPARLTLRSQFYYYAFQWLHRGVQWAHPQATVFDGMESTIAPNDLRRGEGGPPDAYPVFLRPIVRWWQESDLWNAAWHCSSCFRTLEDMHTKIVSASHTEYDTPENREPRTIVERVRNGLDLFGRSEQVYDRIDGNADVPKYILGSSERFEYLLDRDGKDAAFEDYDPES